MKGVDIQLGMAIDSPKATLAVKRRFACEMVTYWNKVSELTDFIFSLSTPDNAR